MTGNRSVSGVAGGIAAVLLLYLVNRGSTRRPGSTINQVVTVGFGSRSSSCS